MLILLSVGLLVVATVLLVLGLTTDSGLTLIYVSIGASVLAGIVLYAAVRLSRRQPESATDYEPLPSAFPLIELPEPPASPTPPAVRVPETDPTPFGSDEPERMVPRPDPGPEPIVEPVPQRQPVAEPEPERESIRGLEPEPVAEPAREPNREPEPEPEREPIREPEPAVEPAREPNREFEPAVEPAREPTREFEPAAASGRSDELVSELPVDFPIYEYDDLTVEEIVPLLPQLFPDEIGIVLARERATKDRPVILARLDQLGAASAGPDPTRLSKVVLEPDRVRPEEPMAEVDPDQGPGSDDVFPIEAYDSLTVAQILPLIRQLEVDELEDVRARETTGAARTTILRAIADRLGVPPPRAARKRSTKKKSAKKRTTKKTSAKKRTTKKKSAKKPTAKKSSSRKRPAKKKATPSRPS